MAADPRRLSFLLAVHRAGGILAAAEILGVTPSAVSQQITRLEAEEGCAVLDRGPRGVSLTAAGRLLAEAAERIEAELVEARNAINALGEGISGQVAIGAFQTSIRSIVTPALQWLAQNYPAISVDVRELEEDVSMRMMRSGELDVAILEHDSEVKPATPSGMADVALIDEPWRLMIPSGTKPPNQLAGLAAMEFVAGEDGTASDRALKRLSRTLGTPMRSRHSTYNFDVAACLVGAGQGVALIPALAVDSVSAQGNVAIVRLPGIGTRHIFVRHRATRREPTGAARAVVDALVAVAEQIDLQ